MVKYRVKGINMDFGLWTLVIYEMIELLNKMLFYRVRDTPIYIRF